MSELEVLRGFGSFHESEALAGALPRTQNNPQRAPYGLYAEQLNATAFTVPRARNRRVWLYRIRPSTCIGAWRPVSHATFGSHYREAPPGPELLGWRPRPAPGAGGDFIDGLATYGGAGDPALKRGFAVHQYLADRDMGRRAFYNADGDLLLLPDTARVRLRTELGLLDVGPGELALIPRGLVFSVDLHARPARGYLFEAYARSFELPERGVVGANSLTDARHFEAPVARYEDDDGPFELLAKVAGRLFASERTGSPFDVVAWHGNLAPLRYDMANFCPVGAVRFDHPDPSIFTVLSAPLDHPGENTADLVVFPERWDVSEHTFRPPYFHRNAVTELNGIVTGPSSEEVFSRGGLFLTPPFSGHGVSEASVARGEADAGEPMRLGEDARWIQLESTFPMQVSPWALAAAHRDPQFGEPVRALPRRFDASAANDARPPAD